MKELLKGKTCKLILDNNFRLTGKVVEVDEIGILFETDQKISFINWTKIKQLTPVEWVGK
jgi:hypothetical protein